MLSLLRTPLSCGGLVFFQFFCLEIASLIMAEETITYMERFYTGTRRTILFKTIPHRKTIAWKSTTLLGTSLSLDLF